ncbi:MAG: EAL domain-containing protein, partial [Burkholderiales bacterium]
LMAEVRPFGCPLTISDFDGSDASFLRLKGLTPEFIKISAANIGPSKLSELARKCQALEIKTIAEHVESKQTLQHLRQSRIDFAQGYEIAPVKPL